MITLHLYPGKKDSLTALEQLLFSARLSHIAPLDLLPLLVEDGLLRTPACKEVLRQLSRGELQPDDDPCYLVYRNGRRRPLFCFNTSWQAALAVAAMASLPRDADLLKRLRRRPFGGVLATSMPGNLCLELTPELCDAQVWRALNGLDLPVDLAVDAQMLEQLRRRLADTLPEDGREPPYRLIQEGGRRPRAVLTHQDTTGWDNDPKLRHEDTPGWSGDILLTGGDGSDLIGFRWQDPRSWYRWDLTPTLDSLPVPRTGPAFSGLSDRYEIRDEMTCQTCLDLLKARQTLYLMILEREEGDHWRADERLLEDCDSYYDLFDAALEGAGTPARWVLAVDLDRPPLYVGELAWCEVLFSFYLYKDTVTLTDGPEALYCFLKALERYGDTGHAPQEEDHQPKEEPSHV